MNGSSATTTGGDNEMYYWHAVIAGDVTCICGTAAYQDDSNINMNGDSNVSNQLPSLDDCCLDPVQLLLPSQQQQQHALSGLCLVGCSDGTLHTLSLACGMRIGMPIVLGAAVAYVDIIVMQQQHDTTSSSISNNHAGSSSSSSNHAGSSSNNHYRVLAVTADGEVWVWNILDNKHNYNNCSSNKGSSSGKGMFQCIMRTNLRPVLISMRCRALTNYSSNNSNSSSNSSNNNNNPTKRHPKSNNNCDNHFHHNNSRKSYNASSSSTSSSSSVRVEQCILTPNEGKVVVSVFSLTAAGTEGGDYQSFCYCSEAQAWTRVADLRHVLSR